MDVDRPDSTEGDEADQGLDREAEQEDGQVDQAHGVNCVHRMLAVSGEPVEVFRAVMDGMEAPEDRYMVLDAVPPVDEKVAEDDYLYGLQPPWLFRYCRAEFLGDDSTDPVPEL